MATSLEITENRTERGVSVCVCVRNVCVHVCVLALCSAAQLVTVSSFFFNPGSMRAESGHVGGAKLCVLLNGPRPRPQSRL